MIKNNVKSVRFYLIKLTVYLFLLMVLLKLSSVQPFIMDFCLMLAKIVAGALGVFDGGIERHGNTVLRYTYGYALTIDKACSGLTIVASLTAATLAYPVPILMRIKAMVVFAVVFQLINLLRISTLVYAKVLFTPHYFDIFHELFWRLLLTTLATALFLVWARKHAPFSKNTFTQVQL